VATHESVSQILAGLGFEDSRSPASEEPLCIVGCVERMVCGGFVRLWKCYHRHRSTLRSYYVHNGMLPTAFTSKVRFDHAKQDYMNEFWLTPETKSRSLPYWPKYGTESIFHMFRVATRLIHRKPASMPSLKRNCYTCHHVLRT
jgi:hypothetical protein